VANIVEIIFYHGPEDLAGRLIRGWTHSPYSHCEIHFGHSDCFSAKAGEGCRFTRVPEANRTAYWGAVPIVLLPDEESRIRQFCIGETGCGYDYWGALFAAGLGTNWSSRNRWFCSEICTAALQVIGMLPKEKPWRMTPGGLHRRITTQRLDI
jgi:hypothetical protein